MISNEEVYPMIKVRTHPVDVYYLTGEDARHARKVADDDGSGSCFTTSSMGNDGFVWNTPEEFEASYDESFGGLRIPIKS